MNKTELIKDLNFIFSKYGNELERGLYPTTENEVQKGLNEFKLFINQIVADIENQLVEKDYSEKEYSKILLSEIPKIENISLFEDFGEKDKKTAEKVIQAVSNEIKKAI